MPSPLARPEGIDLAIVRENLEDAYVLIEGGLAQLAPLKLRRWAALGAGRRTSPLPCNSRRLHTYGMPS